MSDDPSGWKKVLMPNGLPRAVLLGLVPILAIWGNEQIGRWMHFTSSEERYLTGSFFVVLLGFYLRELFGDIPRINNAVSNQVARQVMTLLTYAAVGITMTLPLLVVFSVVSNYGYFGMVAIILAAYPIGVIINAKKQTLTDFVDYILDIFGF
jgi:hypothetical protein